MFFFLFLSFFFFFLFSESASDAFGETAPVWVRGFFLGERIEFLNSIR